MAMRLRDAATESSGQRGPRWGRRPPVRSPYPDTPPRRAAPPLPVRYGPVEVVELVGHPVGVREPELGVDGPGLLPVVAGAVRVAGEVVGIGQAVVCGGLLVPVACVVGEGQGRGVAAA